MSEHDWFDALPAEAQERIKSLEAIVRELAEEGPYVAEGLACLTCEIAGATLTSTTDDPSGHHPFCLWRRAKELTEAALC